MPIIAESPPIVLEIGATPTPTPIIPIEIPTPIVAPSNVLERHRQFISKVDAAQVCFDRNALPGFSNDEFDLHLGIAKIDKYVTDAGPGLYCSNAAVSKLAKSLERPQI